MNREEILAALLQCLDDDAVSRSERAVMDDIIDEHLPGRDARMAVQAQLFDAVRERLRHPDDKRLLDGLEDALRLLRPERARAPSPFEVHFGPEAPMWETLKAIVDGARETLDLAVFTLTDDRLADALLRAHRRGVAVRILSDDDKCYDRGSDIFELRTAGIPVAMDASPYHFHHKFAVVDDRIAITGSYNWTRGADRDNRENLLITHDPRIVRAYAEGFEALWSELND